VGYCEHGNEPSDFIKGGEFLYLHLTKYPAFKYYLIHHHTMNIYGRVGLQLHAFSTSALDGGSKALRNVGILPKHHTAPQPRRPGPKNVLECLQWKLVLLLQYKQFNFVTLHCVKTFTLQLIKLLHTSPCS